MESIRVIFADDEDLILEALSLVISSDPAIHLVGTAHDTDEAIDLARSEAPDVALVDVRMPGGGGTKAAREIRRCSPNTQVLAYSSHQDPDLVLAMLRAGAIGYVSKDEPNEEVLRAIHRSAEGKTSIVVGSLADVAERLAEVLTHRQTSVMRETSERIQRAIDDDVLRMVFQPIVALASGQVVGLEALARFHTLPQRSPEKWFADAARAGLLTDLEVAAASLALAVLDRLPKDMYLSVNASPETLRSPRLLELLEGIAGDRIVLEMTEQSPVADYEEILTCLRPFRDMGVRLAIDDVGAGFASLRHVVLLTPDFMKIDRTLVAGVDSDLVRRTLIGGLMSFANEVGMGVIAEGVETESELETLRMLGVPNGQGFHLGRPESIPELHPAHWFAWPGKRAFGS
jgi:EAL domain-containing protein (putative c-di-GMP-specific phosphodiesterase class I)/CheY-like chemotaxis protein